jgi:hypothetical protein
MGTTPSTTYPLDSAIHTYDVDGAAESYTHY